MTGIDLIAAERKRQIEEEGRTPEHDAQYRASELIDAAICYADDASTGNYREGRPSSRWPWAREWWKTASPIRMLVKAGALIAAEIDRRIARGEAP